MAYKCGALGLMEDGYCTLCGHKHTGADLVRSAPKRDKVTPKVEIKAEPIEWPTFDLGFSTKEVEVIDVPMDKVPFDGMTPVQVAKELIKRFRANFDVEISEVRFNDAKAFYHQVIYAGMKHRLFLGRKTLDAMQYVGSVDYDGVMRKMGVNAETYKGAAAVAWAVAHELAHILQMEEQIEKYGIPTRKRKSGEVHNDMFVRNFRTILEIVPELARK